MYVRVLIIIYIYIYCSSCSSSSNRSQTIARLGIQRLQKTVVGVVTCSNRKTTNAKIGKCARTYLDRAVSAIRNKQYPTKGKAHIA